MTTFSSQYPNTFWAQYIQNVPDTFNNVKERGVQLTYDLPTSNPIDILQNHAQGVAFYRNSTGDYTLFSANDYDWLGNSIDGIAKIIVCNAQTQKFLFWFDVPACGEVQLNHPGGIQVVGDYLVVPIEVQTNAILSNPPPVSEIHFFNLSTMTQTTAPQEVLDYVIYRPSKKAGAVGVTTFPAPNNQTVVDRAIVAVYDNGAMDYYVGIPGTTPLTEIAGQALPHTNYQSINLVTSIDDPLANQSNIYLIGFRSEPAEGSFDDYVDLYCLDPDLGQRPKLLHSRHMITEHGSIVGPSGVHFTYGAGIASVVNKQKLIFLATQQNATFGIFHTNIFEQSSSVTSVQVGLRYANQNLPNGRLSGDIPTSADQSVRIQWGFEGLNSDLSDDDIAQIKFDLLREQGRSSEALLSDLGIDVQTAGLSWSGAYIGNLRYKDLNGASAIHALADPSTASSDNGLYFTITMEQVD